LREVIGALRILCGIGLDKGATGSPFILCPAVRKLEFGFQLIRTLARAEFFGAADKSRAVRGSKAYPGIDLFF
jgi:hypothetical protein